MIVREITQELLESAAEYPVVTILGPRQSGKTTLSRMTFPDKPYLSLEDPDIRIAAEQDPRGFLGQLDQGAILDEIQRLPVLLSYIQGMVDKANRPGQFILTGSHQPRLHEAITQSLAGRTAMLTLWPFSLPELRRYKPTWDPFELIVQGCYPRLHQDRLDRRRFYNSYIQTYIERDVRALIELRNLSQFQSFLLLLAGRVGQLINLASLSNDVGVSSTTIKKWLSVLKASHLVFELPPFFQNIRKRVVKSPKLYFTDVGLASFLLGVHTREQAARDPLRGNLFENLVIAEVFKGALNKGIRPDLYFFRDSRGSEVDLVLREGRDIFLAEIKSASTFSLSFTAGIKRFCSATPDNVARSTVLYTGSQCLTVEDVQVINPLTINDIWDALRGHLQS